ncbi:MAG: hypothetical protein JNK30_10365 [Phenylobacterium sp.]|uniref:hypothetical protein n=1 Tax=Phenylobacterium sp. TaxID=1871053 RepID=UPI001A428250|nr:hypothetical protein [Phenylobacterium sp.]MBL8771774.1 hypothetical protein [Phenylobacterium sp.]
MTGFRILLAAMWVTLLVYTGMVIAEHGMGLVPIFFGDIARMAWPGQFNLDFLLFLMLAGLWTAWRNDFSPLGLALAPVALFGGAGFMLPYLLLLTVQTGGDMRAVLLGRRRAAAG